MLIILQTNVPDFTEPSNWSTNLSDLNSVDYSIWDALQQHGVSSEVENIDHLKHQLERMEHDQPRTIINGAIGQWSKRLLLVVHSHGGEHRFCYC